MKRRTTSGYLASCLRHSAQIQPYGWTSDTLVTLSEMLAVALMEDDKDVELKNTHPHISSYGYTEEGAVKYLFLMV